jgi:hypothetical protein
VRTAYTANHAPGKGIQHVLFATFTFGANPPFSTLYHGFECNTQFS